LTLNRYELKKVAKLPGSGPDDDGVVGKGVRGKKGIFAKRTQIKKVLSSSL
jgi:hypothetical protein